MADGPDLSTSDGEPGLEELDPELWFVCPDHPGGRDLVVGNAHTFPGRIAAVCPTQGGLRYHVSASVVREDCPPATRRWVQGYLAGSGADDGLDEQADPDLWFECAATPGGRDHVLGSPRLGTNTISALCGHMSDLQYHVSSYRALQGGAPATRWWVHGFLAANEPDVPRDADGHPRPADDPAWAAWRRRIRTWHAEMILPDDED